LDASVCQNRVERLCELTGPVTNQVAEVRGVIDEVHQEVAGLLRGPRSVRVRRGAEDVHVPGADLDHEQAVQALEGDGAVDVGEIRSRAWCLPVPAGTAARSCRCYAWALEGSSGS